MDATGMRPIGPLVRWPKARHKQFLAEGHIWEETGGEKIFFVI
jgi:hypothetical protein